MLFYALPVTVVVLFYGQDPKKLTSTSASRTNGQSNYVLLRTIHSALRAFLLCLL